MGFLCPTCSAPMEEGVDVPAFTEWSCQPCDLVLHQLKLVTRRGKPLLRH
jgi:hypothetical protein